MTLTKNDIVNQISSLGFSKIDSETSVNYIIKVLKETLLKGEDILVTGFGKFIVKSKKERKGRNPATGGDLILEKRKVVTFKCSKSLKQQINNR